MNELERLVNGAVNLARVNGRLLTILAFGNAMSEAINDAIAASDGAILPEMGAAMQSVKDAVEAVGRAHEFTMAKFAVEMGLADHNNEEGDDRAES